MSGVIPEEAARHLARLARDGALDNLCDRLGIQILGVFGSAALPEGERLRPARDLDVAVRFVGGRGDLLALVGALVDLTECDRVDVLDLSRADDVARAAAFTPPYLALYERRSGQWADAQMAALTTEMESRWLRELDLALLAGE